MCDHLVASGMRDALGGPHGGCAPPQRPHQSRPRAQRPLRNALNVRLLAPGQCELTVSVEQQTQRSGMCFVKALMEYGVWGAR